MRYFLRTGARGRLHPLFDILRIGILGVAAILLSTYASADDADGKSGSSSDLAEVFLTALTTHDFKTMFDMSYRYQEHLQQIHNDKAQNLWPFWENQYKENAERIAFAGQDTDARKLQPTESYPEFREMADFLAYQHTCQIIETFESESAWGMNLVGIAVPSVTRKVLITFKSAADAPRVGDKPLQQALLWVAFSKKDQPLGGLYLFCMRINKEDKLWGDPSVILSDQSHNENFATSNNMDVMSLDHELVRIVCPAGQIKNDAFRFGTECIGYYGLSTDTTNATVAKLLGIRGRSESPVPGALFSCDLIHAGIDIAASPGSDVFPIANGQVIDVIDAEKTKDFSALGYMVMVQHDQMVAGKIVYSLYLHLRDSPDVKKGNPVTAGQTRLGGVGSTGSADGNHLHIEVRKFKDRYFPKWGNIYGFKAIHDLTGAPTARDWAICKPITFNEDDLSNWIDPVQYIQVSNPANRSSQDEQRDNPSGADMKLPTPSKDTVPANDL